MIKKTYALFIPALMILLICQACQSKKTTEVEEVAVPTAIEIPYPALGNAEVSQLYASTDRVDIIFYDLPISVNQDDSRSAKNTALYVTPASPVVTVKCKPLGRLTWMSEGRIFKEADVYSGPGCQYLLFMENNSPVAANAMSKEGVDFFNNVISQAAKRTQ
jgi:hypothetical protein